MKWKMFTSLVREENCSKIKSNTGRIAELVLNKGRVEKPSARLHKWYPKGLGQNDYIDGYRYIDINNSFYGDDSVLIAEASCCVILLFFDPLSGNKFGAHISAASDQNSRKWLAMELDLARFFSTVDITHVSPDVYMFSNNLYINETGSFEQKNVMRLLTSVLSYSQLEKLANTTILIEGEDGTPWNPHCAIRLGNKTRNCEMEISFVEK